MSIVIKQVPVDWKIDRRYDGSFTLRKSVNGRWIHDAAAEQDEDGWWWRTEDTVLCHLGHCGEESAIDFLWNNRGRSPSAVHSVFCECDECIGDDRILVNCPRCGAEQEDYDGLGVIHCEACGYCVHPAATGDICDICGADVTKQEAA